MPFLAARRRRIFSLQNSSKTSCRSRGGTTGRVSRVAVTSDARAKRGSCTNLGSSMSHGLNALTSFSLSMACGVSELDAVDSRTLKTAFCSAELRSVVAICAGLAVCASSTLSPISSRQSSSMSSTALTTLRLTFFGAGSAAATGAGRLTPRSRSSSSRTLASAAASAGSSGACSSISPSSSSSSSTAARFAAGLGSATAAGADLALSFAAAFLAALTRSDSG